METISCHSNQSSYPTGIKNITFVEGNVLSFSFILLTISEKKNFEFLSRKFTLYVAPSTNQIKRFGHKSRETWRTTQ